MHLHSRRTERVEEPRTLHLSYRIVLLETDAFLPGLTTGSGSYSCCGRNLLTTVVDKAVRSSRADHERRRDDRVRYAAEIDMAWASTTYRIPISVGAGLRTRSPSTGFGHIPLLALVVFKID